MALADHRFSFASVAAILDADGFGIMLRVSVIHRTALSNLNVIERL